ncbi:MAG: glycosyltransferase family 4 protein [Chloroflexi bacterium]|nr:glycosyltransferase family 4 protein [Chloroflexota bacterium]
MNLALVKGFDMHIAFNGWFWNQPFTGSGQYLRHLLAALHEVAPELRATLVVPDHAQTLDNLPPDTDVLPVKTAGSGHMGKVMFEQRGFPRAVERLKATLAHVPYWGPPLRSPVPLVCSVLDVIPLLVPAYHAGFRNRLYTGLVKAAARGATHILTISDASKRDIVQHIGVPAERVTVTLLAADDVFSPDLQPGDEAVRARYGLEDVDDFVLYLGSFVAHKNVELLLAAYTYVVKSMGPDVPLVLAGRPPDTWGTPRFPDLPAYAEKLNFTDDNVLRWIGPVDEADKPALYRLARVFVFPSRYEGFGLGPLEAMASGTPVVACDVSSLPEVVGDAAFLGQPDDPEAMGGAILSLLVEPEHAAAMQQRGLDRARTFSWQQTAERTLAAYRALLQTN